MSEVLAERTYKLVLRKTARGPVIQFRSAIPEKAREATLIRMGGQKSEEVFEAMVGALKKYNLITEEGGTDNYKFYRLKQEIGPAVGGFLVLIRRSRDPTAWIKYFENLITGEKYKGSTSLLSHALALAIELSQIQPPPERVRMQLNPKILDSISAGVKVTVRKLWGIRKP